MKKYFNVDFIGEEFGISIMAEDEEEAKRIATNPFNWKDGKHRIISSITEDDI